MTTGDTAWETKAPFDEQRQSISLQRHSVGGTTISKELKDLSTLPLSAYETISKASQDGQPPQRDSLLAARLADADGIPFAPEDVRIFSILVAAYADAIALEQASERLIATSRRAESQLFRKEYADGLGMAIVRAVCIKDDLEQHPLAKRFRKAGLDIRGPQLPGNKAL